MKVIAISMLRKLGLIFLCFLSNQIRKVKENGPFPEQIRRRPPERSRSERGAGQFDRSSKGGGEES